MKRLKYVEINIDNGCGTDSFNRSYNPGET